MKKLIIIPFLFICLILSATTYYVAPNGDDDDPGTIKEPWTTWGKAFSTAVAGDTVYFRDGIYYHTVTGGDGYSSFHSGTAGNYIHFFNYPGEVPILDCTPVISTTTKSYAIRTGTNNYIKFKGLTVRNLKQHAGDDPTVEVIAYRLYNGIEIQFENCTIYNIDGQGFKSEFTQHGIHRFLNCDAYDCCDSLSISPYLPGNRGVGFGPYNYINTEGEVYYTKCRAWHCGDQGFSGAGLKVTYDECWSFLNGLLQGDGWGFKLGWQSFYAAGNQKVVKNCIAAYNRAGGFTTNDANRPDVCGMTVYNNTAYRNGYFPGYYSHYIFGFLIYNTTASTAEEERRIFKNNISYNNEYGAVYVGSGASYTHDHNNWDIPLILTDTDFQSVDSTGITAARQADGSLPDNNCYNYFLHPSSTSQVIDAGTDLGYGDDIGAFQYEETGVGPLVVFTTTVYPHTDWALAGGNVYDDGGGSIDARGVCWSESENPTIADSHTSDGTGTGVYSSTLTGLSEGTTYHARAYAHNEVGYGYGADVEFETLTSGGGETIVFHNVKMIFHNGKIIVH